MSPIYDIGGRMPSGVTVAVNQTDTDVYICPTCHQPAPHADPLVELARRNAAEEAFLACYPRMYCPACRRRISPVNDNIDAGYPESTPDVRMVCPHCDHRWEVPRRGQP